MKKLIIIIFLSIFFSLSSLAIIWTQQYLVIGLNPYIGTIIFILILLLATGLILWIKNFIGKNISITPEMLFTAALISHLSLLLVFPLFNMNSTLDIQLHDPYYVLSYSYPILLVVLIFAIFAAIYHWFERIFKRKMNQWLGAVHFWITFLGLSYLLLPQNKFISVFIIVIIGVQLLFIYNFCYSLLRHNK